MRWKFLVFALCLLLHDDKRSWSSQLQWHQTHILDYSSCTCSHTDLSSEELHPSDHQKTTCLSPTCPVCVGVCLCATGGRDRHVLMGVVVLCLCEGMLEDVWTFLCMLEEDCMCKWVSSGVCLRSIQDEIFVVFRRVIRVLQNDAVPWKKPQKTHKDTCLGAHGDSCIRTLLDSDFKL